MLMNPRPYLPKPPRLLAGNTVVILTLTIAWIALCGLMVANATGVVSPFAALGGVCSTPLAIGWGLCHYGAVFRRSHSSSRIAAILSFGGAGLAMALSAGCLRDLAVAPRVPIARDLAIMAACDVGLAAHAVFSGVLLCRWARQLAKAEADPARCRGCGYSLVGSLDAGRAECPECGAPIEAWQVEKYHESAPQ